LFFRFSARKKSAQFCANRNFREQFIAAASVDGATEFSLRGGASSTAFAIAQRRMKNISCVAERLFAVFFCRHRIHRSDGA
jgi:hypothetical protein